MAAQRTINVPVETYTQLVGLKERIARLPFEKFTDPLRSLVSRGISLSSVTCVAMDMLEKEVERIENVSEVLTQSEGTLVSHKQSVGRVKRKSGGSEE